MAFQESGGHAPFAPFAHMTPQTFAHMTPQTVRIADAVCLRYWGAPQRSPLWSQMQPWPGQALAGH